MSPVGRYDDPENDTDLGVTPLSNALASVLRARGLGATTVLAGVMDAWPEVVGPELAERVRPVSLRGRELVCEVDSPAWATQLQLLGSELLERLADHLGGPVADQLTVRVARGR